MEGTGIKGNLGDNGPSLVLKVVARLTHIAHKQHI